MKTHPDLLVLGAEQIVTCAPPGDLDRPLAGKAQGDAGVIERAAVAVADGLILAVGPADEVMRDYPPLEGHTRVIHADGRIVVPGFVDAHTHLVYAGSRHREHAMRLAGAKYLDILAAGGGILSTVRATRAASLEELTEIARRRLDLMLLHGTTAAEAKSGYGLDIDTELRQIQAAFNASSASPVQVVSTFMGAHAVPPEFRAEGAEAYRLRLRRGASAHSGAGHSAVLRRLLRKGVFTVDQSRQVLLAGRRRGLIPRYADELAPSGGAELAAEVEAISAEHLAAASPEGIDAMARAGVIAVLLPATMFTLMSDAYADARAMIAGGVPVALATDFNPGTSPTLSMPFVITLACLQMKMTPAEAIVAATRNAACAIGLGSTAGVLAPGRPATFAVLDVEHVDALPFYVGMNPVKQVVVRGELVVDAGALVRRM